jgi:hypothetical protein
MLAELGIAARYAAGLREFLRDRLSPEECRGLIARQFGNRERSFLQVLERAVFANPRSPYRKLLQHAGLEFPDVSRLVRQDGLEAALETLYDQGVYISLDEFKGRKPIRRGRLEIATKPGDFDNPLLARHYSAATSGSRGVRRRIVIDFDLLTHEAAYFYFFLQAFDLTHRPMGTWREIPPGAAGLKLVFRYAKLGKPVEKWFTQREILAHASDWKYALFTGGTLLASRMWGVALPVPQYVPSGNAAEVARWLAGVKAQGAPAVLDTNAGAGARVCIAAERDDLDIAGTFFRFGGEPFTAGKARLVEQAGAKAVCHYHMSEIGTLGMACATPEARDDVHLVTDKVGVIQRELLIGDSGRRVGALVLSSLLPSCPKIMLNVQSDDYGVLAKRACGCVFGELGFHWHLHGIRSYEKLTSSGVTFLGSELLDLVEEVLPARFGGSPVDYQFVEEEEDGLTRVSLVVSPKVGRVDEAEVVRAVLQRLSAVPGGRLMAGAWERDDTLRVDRREPYASAGFKILPLHVLENR